MPLPDDLEAIEAAARRSAAARGARAILVELARIAATSGEAFATALLDATLPRVAPTLAAAVRRAWAAGIADAAAIAGGAVPEGSIATARLRAIDRDLAASLSTSLALVRGGADAESAAAPLLGALAMIDRVIRSEIVSAAGAAVVEVGRLNGVPLVWQSETNACVRCLAYSGLVAEAGAAFPRGLTFGKPHPSVLAAPAVRHPPLHPNCRCTLEPLGSQEYADALRREAERSILRGFSLTSEPMSVRIDAARRLLEAGVDAPASVIAFARRAVRAGAFPTRGRP